MAFSRRLVINYWQYDFLPLPSAPSFSAHEIQRGKRERGGVREVKKPAKPCRILDPNRR